MTVKELIDKLSTMPPDAPVVFNYCSDYADMEPGEVTMKRLICRNGHWMDYNAKYWDKREGAPQMIDVCHFPGN